MKKIVLILLALTIASFGAPQAKKNYRAVPIKQAQILQSGQTKMFCGICGMTLPMFYKTNHSAKIDGKTHQYCSIHCMYEDAMKKGMKVNNPQVVDNDTLKFIDSKKAFFVVGSKKPATMSVVSKYAFGSKKTAEKFAKKFGGKIVNFETVSKEVKAGLKGDIALIQKRQAKAAKMGKKIYNKMCKRTDKRFKNPANAKAFIKKSKLCGKLKGKPFQQVGLYLSGK